MKIGLVGVGAIGTILAAHIAKQNHSLYVVTKYEETLEKIKSKGIEVQGVHGNFSVKQNVEPVLNVDDLPENLDAIFIVTKTIDLETVFEDAINKLSPEGFIVTTQNGVVEEDLFEKYPEVNLLPSTISFGATLLGPAISEQTSRGEIVLGRKDGKSPQSEIERKIYETYNKIEPTKWSDNIIGVKYSKLLINSAISALGAVSGLTLGKMMKRKNTRLAFLRIISEGVDVANKNNIKLENLNKLNFYKLAIPLTDYDPNKFSLDLWKKHLLLQIIGRKYKNLKSSTLQSIERGKKTEIEHLNGHLVKKGKQVNADIRLNEFIVNLVRQIEKKEKTPNVNNLINVELKTLELYD